MSYDQGYLATLGLIRKLTPIYGNFPCLFLSSCEELRNICSLIYNNYLCTNIIFVQGEPHKSLCEELCPREAIVIFYWTHFFNLGPSSLLLY